MNRTRKTSRMQTLANEFLDALLPQEKPRHKPVSKNGHPRGKRQRLERKDFSCYMQLVNHDTQEVVGHLADISSGGFKLDSQRPIPPNRTFRFQLGLSSEVADKPEMVFVACSRWCQADPLDPFIYNVGFQLTNMASGDLEIFNRMIERYGRNKENLSSIDLRRTNKW